MVVKRKIYGLGETLNRSLSLIVMMLAAAIGLSPFYIWSSGWPQLSHLLFLVALILWILMGGSGPKSWVIPSFLKYGLALVIYSALINLVVFFLHQDHKTLLASVYYLFNIVSFIFVAVIISRQVDLKRFLEIFYSIFWLSLIFSLMVMFFCLGRAFGGYRAMSTFNDPNQFAHWLLWVVLIISTLGWAVRQSWLPGVLAFGLAASGILASQSRSGMLGLAVIVLTGLFALLYSKSRSAIFLKFKDIGVIKAIGVMIIFLLPLLYANILMPRACGPSFVSQAPMHSQLYERVMDRGVNSSFEGRGYDRLWKFPQYLFFGAGEAANHRWVGETIFHGEIHSTFAGVWFYYGLPGLILLLLFLYGIWKSLDSIWVKLMFFAPLAYSLGTYNLRNWMFWIGLAFLVLGAEYVRQSRNQG